MVKDSLYRIRKGELQLFITVLERYLPAVYRAAEIEKASEAVEICRTVFSSLYKDIINALYIFRPQHMVESRIRKFLRKQGVSGEVDFELAPEEVTIPPETIRLILYDVSQIKRDKNQLTTKKAAIAISSMVLFLIGLVYYANVYAVKADFNNFSHNVKNIQQDIPYQHLENTQLITYKPDTALLLGENPDGALQGDFYFEGQISHTAFFPGDTELLWVTERGDLIFRDNTSLMQFSPKGDLIRTKDFAFDFVDRSHNERYVVVKSGEEYVAYDLENWQITDCARQYLLLTEQGKLITESEYSKLGLPAATEDYLVLIVSESPTWTSVYTVDKNGVFRYFRDAKEVRTVELWNDTGQSGGLFSRNRTQIRIAPDERNLKMFFLQDYYGFVFTDAIATGDRSKTVVVGSRAKVVPVAKLQDNHVFSHEYDIALDPDPVKSLRYNLVIFASQKQSENVRLHHIAVHNYRIQQDFNRYVRQGAQNLHRVYHYYRINMQNNVTQMALVGREDFYAYFLDTEGYLQIFSIGTPYK